MVVKSAALTGDSPYCVLKKIVRYVDMPTKPPNVTLYNKQNIHVSFCPRIFAYSDIFFGAG
ncbi:hypothetical protein D3C78_1717200 [compost metagenome]